MDIRRVFCLFNRHMPRRSKVKWDGLNFVGPCRFCGTPIRKLDDKKWRKDEGEPAT
mgnify:CR=1 FL=1